MSTGMLCGINQELDPKAISIYGDTGSLRQNVWRV